ncbi:hypothetical protein F383_31775 [Gossypium arboreum]|uniref:Uncharacterized protein n=1 Tax=Gossypium arboreum TaxID=29729 RepID=A0A0B0MXU4_GOSAR|nr:hypothetical protein F383_31775 [Gossypium arboreum]
MFRSRTKEIGFGSEEN